MRGACAVQRFAGAFAVACAIAACATPAGRTDAVRAPAPDDEPPAGRPYVFAGLAEGTIVTLKVDPGSGALTAKSRVDAGGFSAHLAADPSGRVLCAANPAAGTVAAFAIAPRTGALSPLSRASTGGARPTAIAMDRKGKYLFVVNEASGTIAVLPLKPDGSLGDATTFPVAKGSNALAIHPANDYLVVAQGKAGTIAQFSFALGSGMLTPKQVAPLELPNHGRPGALAFAPTGRFAYVLDEVNRDLVAYVFDPGVGALASLAFQVASLLGDGKATAKSDPVAVAVAPSGKFVYAGTRGPDVIAAFSVQGETGDLDASAHVAPSAKALSAVAVDPTGDFLYAAYTRGRQVASFRLDPATGAASKADTVDLGGAPVALATVRAHAAR